MKAGTAKKRKFIPVHDTVEHLQIDPEVLKVTARKAGDERVIVGLAGHKQYSLSGRFSR